MAKFAVILPAAGQEQPVSRQELQEAVRATGQQAGLAALGREVSRPRGRQAVAHRDLDGRPRVLSVQVRGQHGDPGHRRRRRGRRAVRLGRQGTGAREARHRLCVRARRGAAPAWPTSGFRRCSRRPKRRAPRFWRIPVSSTLKRVAKDHTDRRDGAARRIVGSTDAASLSPAAAARRPRQARRICRPPMTPQLVERLGHTVTIVTGSPINLKITTREDLRLAEQALKALPSRSCPARATHLPTTTCGAESADDWVS